MKDYTDGNIAKNLTLIGHFDGGCEPMNPGGVCTAAWVLYDGNTNEKLALEGKIVRDGRQAKPKDLMATNNYAEYCALGLMLRFLKDHNWKGSIKIYADSKLVVHQVRRDWKCNAPHLKTLRDRIWALMQELDLELGDGFDFECFTCGYKGSMDELVDIGGDDESQDICPKCHNVVSGFMPPSNLSLEWVPREQNEDADATGRAAYAHYLKSYPKGPKT